VYPHTRVSRSCVRDAPPHTPAFWEKRPSKKPAGKLDLLDSKGVDFFGSDNESAIV